MPVTSQHPEYDKAHKTWKKMRDVVAGQEQVHANGETYLPKLGGQTESEYKAYKGRALFLAATGKTVDSLSGMVFRKPVEVEAPASMEPWVEDITASGVSVEQLCKESLNELTTVGRYGLMVDYPQATDTDRPDTVANATSMGFRPRAKQYNAEHIINWQTGTVNNEEILTMVVLKEMVPDPIDEFDTSTKVEQYRVLDLEGGYRQRVFKKDGNGSDWNVVEEFWPTMNGSRMSFIPFIIVGVDGENTDVDIPPLNDLADINLSHYQAYADYRHGLHFTGLPTMIVTGSEEPKGGMTVGSASAAFFPAPETEAFFLEFEGKGLDEYSDEIDNLEKNMAIFGARLLRESKKVGEAAETASINRAGESSLLASWANIVGASVQHALEIMAEWGGVSGEISVQLNTDFIPQPMDAQRMTALLGLWQGGAITHETLIENLMRGEVVSEGTTPEDEIGKIEIEGPKGMEVE